jgi:probable HAF family extracellular repeat protein
MTGSLDSVYAQAPPAYHVEDLGSLGGQYLIALAINNNGDVAGYGDLPDGTYHAFRWTRSGGLEDLGANGGWLSQAYGLNDNGDVVGVYIDSSNDAHGFIARRGGVMKDLRTPERPIVDVYSITNDGQMTGMLFSFTPSFQGHAFRTLADGTLQDLGNTVYASRAWHLNESGEVTGYEATTAFGDAQSAFRFSDAAGKVNLGTLGGARSSGLSINSSGVVVGWSEDATPTNWSRAFRARPGLPIEDLGTLGSGVAGAEGINDTGAIVGWTIGPLGWTGFLYTDDAGMIDLITRIPPPTSGSRIVWGAHGINNAGQIILEYEVDARHGTYLLTPLQDTEPPVMAALAAVPNVLWPANGRMVSVAVQASATDNFDLAPTCSIAGVIDSEGPAAGADPDIVVTGALTLSLRARRSGTGLGRSYRVSVGCTDRAGNASTADTVVYVPHDRRR